MPVGQRPEGGELRGGCRDVVGHAPAHIPYPWVRGARYCTVCCPVPAPVGGSRP